MMISETQANLIAAIVTIPLTLLIGYLSYAILNFIV